MAFPFYVPTPVVINVAAGQTATIRPEAQGTYFGLRLKYTRGGAAATPAQIASDIKQIRVILDDKVQWELTAAQLQMINSTHRINPDNGIIPLWFSEPNRVTEGAQDIKAWGMFGIKSFRVEVDIDAAAPTPTLSVSQYWTNEQSPMGEIRKFKRETFAVAGAADVVMNDLTKNERQLALHFNAATTVISNIKVKIDNAELINAPSGDLHSLFKEWGYVPQTGWTHLAYDHRDRVLESANPFILQQDGTFPPRAFLPYQVTLTFTGAATVTMVKELMGPRD